METQGSDDIILYAQRIGIVTFPNNDEAVRLDVKNAMAFVSPMSFQLFFDCDLGYCKKKLCLEHRKHYTFSEIYELSLLEMFRNLKADKNYKVQLTKDFVSYLKKKMIIQGKFKPNFNETIILTIKEMNEKYASKYLDWRHMINSQLLNNSHKTLDDKILINNPQLMEGLYKLFTEMEET